MPKKFAFCIAASRNQADLIVDRLKMGSFPDHDISALFPDNGATCEFAHVKNTKAPEGASASTSGKMGREVLWIAGIAALAIPGVNPFYTAGPIIDELKAAAGRLTGMGIPEREVELYAGKIRAGNILICVQTKEAGDISRAKYIFMTAGAQDIGATAEASTPADNLATKPAPILISFAVAALATISKQSLWLR